MIVEFGIRYTQWFILTHKPEYVGDHYHQPPGMSGLAR
jgi:hypothetical protein